MYTNREPASLGTIEEVPVAGLTLGHVGRQVGFPYDGGRIHGRLTEVDRLGLGDIRLIVNGQTFHVEVDTPVRVIVQTAAEAAAERRTKIIEEENA